MLLVDFDDERIVKGNSESVTFGSFTSIYILEYGVPAFNRWREEMGPRLLAGLNELERELTQMQKDSLARTQRPRV